MSEIKDFIESIRLKNSNEPEFIQAVEEFLHSIIPFVENNKKYQGNNLLNRISISKNNLWVNNMSYNQIEIVHHLVLLLIIDLLIGKSVYKA